MKRTLIALTILLLIICLPVRADELSDEIHAQMSELKIEEWQSFIEETEEGLFDLDVAAMLAELAEGKAEFLETDFLTLLLKKLKGKMNAYLALFSVLSLVGVVGVISKGNAGRTSLLSGIIARTVGTLTVCAALAEAASLCRGILDRLVTLNGVMMSVGLPLVVASGGSATASVLQPSTLILSETLSGIMRNVLLPFAVVSATTGTVGALLEKNRLSGMAILLRRCFNWGLGIVFTVMGGSAAIKTFISAGFDGTSIRVFKYTVGNSVPVIGGMLSDGVDLVLGCTLLLKNSVGICAVFCVIWLIGMPILQMLAFSLTLRASGAFLSAIGAEQTEKIAATAADGVTSLVLLLLTAGILIALAAVLLITAGGSIGWIK